VEVIQRGEPACLLAHWTGIWFNGRELGFKVFQEVVRRLHVRFDHLLWMKLSEIARYWAARELTRISRSDGVVTFQAPFACSDFTIQLLGGSHGWRVLRPGHEVALRPVSNRSALTSGTWYSAGDRSILCFDLPRGSCSVSPALRAL
jgi:hypothetical protein